MFERFTEQLRRAVFFALLESREYGSPVIEPEHLLLGVVREDQSADHTGWNESIRHEVEARITIREKLPPSAEPPLSDAAKRVLAFAVDEANQFGHHEIGAEHLLLGILREDKCVAAEVLNAHGIEFAAFRNELARDAGAASASAGGE